MTDFGVTYVGEPITPRMVVKVLEELGKIEPMSQLIIERHFGIGERAETLAEIARRVGKDVSRIRLLEANALRQVARRASRGLS